jgi:hypothetical protein
MDNPDPWNDGSDEPCKGCGQIHPRHQKWSDPSLSREDANMRAFMTVCKWAKAVKEASGHNGVEPLNAVLFYWPKGQEQVGVGECGGEWLGPEDPADVKTPTLLDILEPSVEAIVANEGALGSLGAITEAWVPNIESVGPNDEVERVEYYGSAVTNIGTPPPTNPMVACWVYYDEEGRIGCFGALIPIRVDGGEVVCDTLMLAEVKPGQITDEDKGPLTEALVAALTKSAA